MSGKGGEPGILIGFGKASIYPAYSTEKKLADDIDVRVLVAGDNENTAVLAIADLCSLWPSTCLRLRDKVSGALDVPRRNTGIFITQNHSALFEGGDDVRLDAKKFDAAFLAAVKEARANMKPVEIARVAVRPEKPLNICRRFPLKGFGKFTVYYGHRVEGGEADAGHVISRVLNSLKAGNPLQIRAHNVLTGAPAEFDVPAAPIPVPRPFYAAPAEDNLIQALFFRTLDGKPHGSILRFASHPITANHLEMDWQSGDYPAYARRRLETEFGGMSVFLTGPCGNQTPLTARKSLEFARKHGREVADAALKGLAGASWEQGGRVRAASPEVVLKVRKDCPDSLPALEKEKDALEAQIREMAASGAPLTGIKKLSDRYEFLNYHARGGLFHDWAGIRFEQLPGRKLRHPLFVMRIGRSVIAGLPGEPFGEYSVRLRKETLGDDLIVIEEANGWTSYYPTKEECGLGGYEADNDLFDPDSEDVLIAGAKKAIAEVRGDA